MATLPIDALLPRLRQALERHASLVLQAAPGAGKTTRVPLALLDSAWLGGGRILMLEPRRVAVRAAARFMAASLGEAVGQTVGYRVRHDRQIGERTRIEVVSEGILVRLVQQDPTLAGVGAVIFDEFHERSLAADLGLALCRDSQRALRPDLRLLVMSATLDDQAVAALLDGAPVLASEGRSYPVTLHYRALRHSYERQRLAWCAEVATRLADICDRESGSLLVFLPGEGEIRQLQQALRQRELPGDVQVVALYGRLEAQAQDAAIQPAPAGRRKLVLATSIAETSLTIEGVRVVVDAGLARELRFDANSGLDRLVTVPVSQASARQRAGRAGRLEPGVCYRLWPQTRSLVPRPDAEILRADLAPLVLELAHWGETDYQRLCWLDAPPAAHVAQARELLGALRALDERGLVTAHGRAMLALGVHPRLAHMMLCAREHDCVPLACELAALLSEPGAGGGGCDLESRLGWLHAAEPVADNAKRRRIQALADRWGRQLGVQRRPPARDDDRLCGALLAFAYPDRIAQRRPGDGNRFLLSNGRGACFSATEPLAAQELIVAADLAGGREARVFLAAALDGGLLNAWHRDLMRETEQIVWDARAGCVQATHRRVLGQLVLSERPLSAADPTAVARALLAGIRDRGLGCLPWDTQARQLQDRVNFLRALAPAEWPDFSAQALLADAETWLMPHLHGLHRLAQLKTLDLPALLRARLDWRQLQRLDEWAPTYLQVPSGSRLRVDYSGEIPVLAVRLQEMFGLAHTPCVAGGQVPLLLHLLSPAQRPVQVTRDLSGFWSGSYQAVRKELRGRYPKHAWPEDPLRASPATRKRTRQAEKGSPR